MYKNVASQKLTVIAFADAGHASLDAGEPVTGDAANISMKVEQDDDGTRSTSNDVAPTETEDGQYVFDLTQAETNGDKLTFYPESSTAGVQVVALPSSVIYTMPQYFADLGIASDGDLSKVNTLNGHTAQTGDSYAYLGTNLGAAGANATEVGGTGDQFTAMPWNSAWDAEVQSEVADALTAFGWSGITISAVSGAVGSVTGTVGSVTGTVGGIAGTITTLDALDTAQDTQHAATLTRLGTPADTDVSTDILNVSSRIGNLAVGAGGISVAADSFTLTTGTESAGTVANTEELDGVVHTITPVTSIDCYYEFNVGINGVATEVLWDGYAGNNGDTVEVYGYDWVSAGWKQIGSLTGKNANSNEEQVFLMTAAMTGTAANSGVVRLRFASSGASVAVDLNTDRIWCEYTSVAEEAFILHSGIAQGGASSSITLDSGASAIDDFYNHTRVVIKSGTGEEQERLIFDYVGATKVAKVTPPWKTNPDSTSAFEIEPGLTHTATDHQTVRVGVAQAGGASTITLDANASAVADYYKGDSIEIISGTGEGQSRVITAYNQTTKVATVSRAWITNPDSTSEFLVNEASVDVDAIGGEPATATATVNFDDFATILADTNELQTDDVPGLIAALNDIDGTGLTVDLNADQSAVTIGTVTTNSDMRGTDSALLASAAPANFSDMDIAVTTGKVTVGTNDDKTGYSISGSLTTLDALDTAQDTQHGLTRTDIGNLNDIAATDIVSNGAITTSTGAVSTVTDVTLPVTTDSASRTASQADISSLATSVALATVDTNVDSIKTKTDQFAFTVANQVDANALSGGGSGLDAAGVRSAVGLASANLDTQLGDIPTVSEFEARTLLAAAYFDASTDSVDLNADQSGVTIGTVTTNSDMRGTDSANTTVPDNASIALILTDTGTTIPATLGVPADTDLATDIANIDAGTAPTAAAVADAVWDEAMSGHTTAGTFGKLFDGITNLAAWLGLGLGKTADSSTLAEVNATTAGAGYDNTSDSQQAIVDRGSSGPWTSGSVTGDAIITPLSASEVSRTNGTDITYFVGEAIATTIAITDSSGAAVDLSAKTLRIIIDRGGSGHSDVEVIASGSITVAGASSNQITFTNSAAVTNKAGSLRWALRDTDDGDRVLARGNVRVIETAEEDG